MVRVLLVLLLLIVGCVTKPSRILPPVDTVTGCLHTHFNHPIGVDTLAQVYAFRFRVARIDAQGATVEAGRDMIREIRAAGLMPLVVVRDGQHIRDIGEPGIFYELRNEPDLEGPSPAEYRTLMPDALAAATELGSRLYVGAVSNLNDRGFDYLRAIRSLPAGVFVSVHRYGDGSFDAPHRGFEDREREVYWLRETIGMIPFAVTEFGYPDDEMGEQQAAERIRQEFEFWAGKAQFACLYQLNDGASTFSIDHFGIRRLDGSWKPSAYVLGRE